MGDLKNSGMPNVLAKRSVCSLRADGMLLITASEDVPAEHLLNVFLDEQPIMRLVCTATCLKELVVGRLFSEGIVASVGGIESARFSASFSDAYVTSKRASFPLRATTAEFVPSATAGSRVFVEASDGGGSCRKVDPVPWSPSDVFALARVFSADSPMHRSTSGVHSCYLAHGAEILCRCEDIGRHNAFDKVIGYGLINNVDLRACMVFSSGRLPVDMVSKAIRAGIPILVSKSVTTDCAIQLAQECDLTLICSAWPDSMRVYNDPSNCAMAADTIQPICVIDAPFAHLSLLLERKSEALERGAP